MGFSSPLPVSSIESGSAAWPALEPSITAAGRSKEPSFSISPPEERAKNALLIATAIRKIKI